MGDAGLTGPQDHRRLVRRHGPPRRWRILRQGSDEGRPVCGVRRALGRQERRRGRAGGSVRGRGRVRHRDRPADQLQRRLVRDRQDRGFGDPGTDRAPFRSPPRVDHRRARPSPAVVPPDRGVWPFRSPRPRPALGADRQGGDPLGRRRRSRSRSRPRPSDPRPRPGTAAAPPARRLHGNVRRRDGRWRRYPAPPTQPARATEAVSALARRHGTLLQASVARLAGLTDDVTIVADRRYEALAREQAPGAQFLLEPLGRNTAAAIALAALAIDRPEDEVMVVVAADQTVEKVPVFQRGPGGGRADRDGSLRHR